MQFNKGSRSTGSAGFTWSSIFILLVLTGQGLAEGQTATIAGTVSDPSGRVVPAATLVAVDRDNKPAGKATTNGQGQYEIKRISPGTYTLRVNADGFAPYEDVVTVAPALKVATMNVALSLAVNSEQVTVSGVSQVDINAENNASALVIKGKDMESLSDDRDDFAADLQALAGSGAGPNEGQIYIDGFTGGRIPPKSAIRDIHINQNPFSAEYDKLGYGRIEIDTKPGESEYHGEFVFMYGNDIFNSRNPFATVKPPYERKQWEGEVGGPLGKKTSFFTDFEVRQVEANAFINAVTLDSQFNEVRVAEGVVTPRSGDEYNVRLDRQLTDNQTLTFIYGHQRDDLDNQGVGGFSLASRAYKSSEQEDSFEVSETGIYGAHFINETHFRYLRQRTDQNGNAGEATILVPDAFTGGGPPLSVSFNHQDHYEFRNLTSYMHGAHFTKWGVRFRQVHLDDQDTQDYKGTFTFSSLDSYRLTLIGMSQGLTGEQIRQSGGGASQFSLTAGNPLAEVSQFDAGLFVQDDWKLRPNLSLSLGLRYETQTNLSDWHSVAPRAALAWAVGPKGKSKTVIRTGGGIFYDRVGENLYLDAYRQNGIRQQQFLINAPNFFPLVPTAEQLGANAVPSAVGKVQSDMLAPQIVQGAFSVEHAFPKKIALSSNYVHTQGIHQLRSRNISAPLDALSPYSATGPLYLYEASGRFRQDQWITSVNGRPSARLNFSGSYTLGKASSDTDGATTFPSYSYDLRPEFGRAAFDVRHRFQLNGFADLPWGIRVSPFLIAASGKPFNITSGQDLNGDSLFTDRPALATDLSRPSVVHTVYGVFDVLPQPGQTIIKRNLGNGPAQLNLNVRLSKTFKFGKEEKGPGGKGSEPKELVFSAVARNVLNHPNYALPVGNLSSPLFGQSTALAQGWGGGIAGNRRIDLQVRFTF